MSLETKFENLKKTIGNFPRVVVAYSGGVDSTLLLKVCVDVLGRENVLALIGISPTYPKTEIEEAKKLADLIGANSRTIDTREMENPRLCGKFTEPLLLLQIAPFPDRL